MNCRMKTMSSAVTALPRYRHSTGICRQCARTKTGTQALGANYFMRLRAATRALLPHPDHRQRAATALNRQPEKGSAASFSRHSCARESMPFLPSTASVATRMRSCGVICIRTPAPTAPGSTLPDTKPERSSTGFAACRDGLPVRSCIREAMPHAAPPVPRMPANPVAAESLR